MSDWILTAIADNLHFFSLFQTYKGLSYVGLTSIIFYIIIHRAFARLREKEEVVRQKNAKLEADNEEFMALNRELEESYIETNNVASNLETMIDLVSSLGRRDPEDEEEFLSSLLQTATQIIPEADYGTVYTFEEGQVNFVDARGHDIEILKETEIEAELFEKTTPKIIIIDMDIDEVAVQFTEEVEENYRRAVKPFKQSMIFGLYDGQRRIAGIGLDIAVDSEHEFDERSIRIARAFKNLASAFYTMGYYSRIKEKFQQEIIKAMLQMLEIHDVYTRGHSQEVARLSRSIAERLELAEDEVTKSYWAGMVHDLGKTLIPGDILNKSGRLTGEEFEIIKKHPVWGYRTLQNSSHLRDVAEYVLYHHERWDGRGYPEGMKGEEIPLISRIICAADSWDAMRSRRAYRPPLSREEALKEIRENRGSQFGPRVAKALLDVLNDKQE